MQDTAKDNKGRLMLPIIVGLAVVLAMGLLTAFVVVKQNEPKTTKPVVVVTRGDQFNAFTISRKDKVTPEPPVMVIHEDPKCHYCKDFEKENFKKLLTAVKDGRITLRLEMQNILDPYSGTGDYSTRAIGAMVSLVDHNPDAFLQFHQWLYDNQPEGYKFFSNEELSKAMRDAGAGDEAIKDFSDGAWRPQVLVGVMKSQEGIYDVQEKISVPVIVFNGEKVDRDDPDWINKTLPPTSTPKKK